MKKLIILFLVCSQASGAFGSQLACRDLFLNSHIIDSASLNPYASANDLRSQLDQYQTLSFKKQGGFFSRLKQKFGGSPPADYQFNLLRFRTKVDHYAQVLSNPSRTGELFEDVVPKTLEDSLALMEAKSHLDPNAMGIDTVTKWLASATQKDVKRMAKLLEFKNGQSPAALYTQVAKIYLLVHSEPSRYSDILKMDLDARAARMIANRAMISFLTNNYKAAIEDLGIKNPTGAKAYLRKVRERYPNASSYSLNIALGAAEITTFGMPIFTQIREINVLQNPISRITDGERLQIIRGDFRGLDPQLQKRLVRIAKTEIVWKRFLQVLAIAGVAYLMYFVQDEIRHDWFSTLSAADRTKLEDAVLAIYLADLVVRHQPTPSQVDIDSQKEDIKDASDADLERTVHAGWHLVAEARAELVNPSDKAPVAAPVSQKADTSGEVDSD